MILIQIPALDTPFFEKVGIWIVAKQDHFPHFLRK